MNKDGMDTNPVVSFYFYKCGWQSVVVSKPDARFEPFFFAQTVNVFNFGQAGMKREGYKDLSDVTYLLASWSEGKIMLS